MLHYGVAEIDYTLDSNGKLTLTDRSNTDANYVNWKYPMQHPQVMYVPDIPCYARAEYEAEQPSSLMEERIRRGDCIRKHSAPKARSSTRRMPRDDHVCVTDRYQTLPASSYLTLTFGANVWEPRP